jgi:hypothetical protein
VLGLTVAVVVVAVGPGAGGAVATCPAVAVISGPAEITARTSAIVRAHGVAAPPTRCGGRVVRAVMADEAAGRGYTLHIEDGYGRVTDRRIAGDDQAPLVAASLIESWATDEDAAILRPLPLPGRSRPEPAPSGDDAVAARADADASAGLGAGPWTLNVAGELADGSDDSTWTGASAGVCRRFGDLCLGLDARLANDNGGGGLTADLARRNIAALATVSWPLAWRRLRVAPRVGAGVSWTRSSILPAPLTVSGDDWDVVAEVGARTGVALGARWQLFVDFSGDVGAPLHEAPREELGYFLLPVPPTWLLRAAVGIGLHL